MAKEKLDESVESWLASLLACGPNAVRLQKKLILDWDRMGITDGARAGIQSFDPVIYGAEGLVVLFFAQYVGLAAPLWPAAGVAFARQYQIEVIVAVGGGSSMDCAKGVNFILTNGGQMSDYKGIGKATKFDSVEIRWPSGLVEKINGAAIGNHALKVVAKDNSGISATSAVVNIVVANLSPPPLTYPTNNAPTPIWPAAAVKSLKNSSGTNTAMWVRVEARIADQTSSLPSMAASQRTVRYRSIASLRAAWGRRGRWWSRRARMVSMRRARWMLSRNSAGTMPEVSRCSIPP
mgnify:CR=1 FL=1